MQFQFDDHTLDTDTRELWRGTVPVAVEPQVFDLLAFLVQTRDRVVTKDDLIAQVWGGRIVSDSTLTSRINAARKAIGDSGEAQRLIRTITRKGIRFVGAVSTRTERQHFVDPANVRAESIAADMRPDMAQMDRPAIAVLPFVNMSDEAEQEHFADGISEDIIAALSRLRWFFVVARNSSFAYKGKSVHLKQMAGELGVGYVVEGSVRKSGKRVRITAQLNDVATGRQIWAEHYDRKLADMFEVQDEITEAIVGAIVPQLYAAEDVRARRKPPESLDAWELVARALAHFWKITREDNGTAQRLLDKAITIDPNYGQALGVLAVSHAFGVHMGWEDRTFGVPSAERAALAAVRADNEDAWAHLAVACVDVCLGRFDDSLAGFEQALRLNPNFALAQGFYALVITSYGRWQEASAVARRALRLSPRDPFSAIYSSVAAYAEYVGKNYDEAIRLGRESVRLHAEFVGGHRVLTAAAGMAGDTGLAKTALRDLLRAQPNFSLAWAERHLLIRDGAEREHYLEGFRRAGLS
ncbi:MAG TPA: winged helix-turn-helix domain-containing tetratricopeptide repeat protein [Alphaproteobacteria bacterium]|nr:winged helix-turn-helix domain-containing tetratricopeptide repeat protein [Alphaproteobacteria bacterium]